MPSLSMRLLLPVALLLVAPSATAVAQDKAETQLQVSIGPDGCQPSSLDASAGVIDLEITNAGGDVGEFEILAGDRMVDELENVLPGFVMDFSTRLDGGDYQLVCYSLQSPRGTLTVGGGPAATRGPSAVIDPAVLDGYRATYAAWVAERAATLVSGVDSLAEAVRVGDLDAARAAYPRVRVPWEQIEPVAELFADLDTSIDARQEDFAAGVDDPAFTGFHRIERLLWVEGASGDLGALATRLAADVRDLQTRLTTLDIEPRVMARGAGELIDEVAQSKLTGEEDRYSGTDLWSIRANLDGSRFIVDVFRPTLETLDPERLARIDAAFAAVDEVMARYVQGDGFAAFSAIPADELTLLQARMAGLAEELAALPGLLGLQV